MKLLRETIRKILLTETVYPKIMAMIDKLEELEGFVKIDGSEVAIRIRKPTGRTKKLGSVKWGSSPFRKISCLGAKIVISSEMKMGFGPLAYDVAIEYTGGLTPDRTAVSGSATRVWDRYLNNRPDVQVSQLDNDQNLLTPENEDNCGQRSAIADQGGDNFWDSSLSKVYKKSGTPVMDELRKRGMLKE